MTATLDELKDELIRMGKVLFEKGLSNGSAGNLSLRGPDGKYLMTYTGCSLGALEKDKLSVIDGEGNLLEGAKPTKEYPFHLAYYRVNPSVNAIVHTHSIYATAYACLEHANPGDVLKPMTPYLVMKLDRVILTPYRKPGSIEIAEDIASHGDGHKAYLLANHGMVVGGKNGTDALNNAQELEDDCHLYFLTQGCRVRYLTDAEVSALRK
ncbi:MAG TPA: class II aldolase/adducin family protein [Candidatus Avisuccinivibrio pullicola]|nr:class II aldolase/adducin family protein [Candidatus Avisuccinivibrio pullicola]